MNTILTQCHNIVHVWGCPQTWVYACTYICIKTLCAHYYYMSTSLHKGNIKGPVILHDSTIIFFLLLHLCLMWVKEYTYTCYNYCSKIKLDPWLEALLYAAEFYVYHKLLMKLTHTYLFKGGRTSWFMMKRLNSLSTISSCWRQCGWSQWRVIGVSTLCLPPNLLLLGCCWRRSLSTFSTRSHINCDVEDRSAV